MNTWGIITIFLLGNLAGRQTVNTPAEGIYIGIAIFGVLWFLSHRQDKAREQKRS